MQRLTQNEETLAELVLRRKADRRQQTTLLQDAISGLQQDALAQFATLQQDVGVYSQQMENALSTQNATLHQAFQNLTPTGAGNVGPSSGVRAPDQYAHHAVRRPGAGGDAESTLTGTG